MLPVDDSGSRRRARRRTRGGGIPSDGAWSDSYRAAERAREVVEKIYAEIGVRVIWRSTTSHPSGCSKAPLRRSIVVAIAAKTPVGMSGSAFAYANPLCGRRALRAAADGPIAGDGQDEST